MRSTHLILPFTAALTLAACGDRNDTTTAEANVATENLSIDDSAMADAPDGNLTAPAAVMPSTPQEFADLAAASDQFEIESGTIAQEKAQAGPVKEFAAMLVKDHTKSTADLKAAAGQADPAITPAPVLDAEQTANLAALRAASGADFDRLYIQQQIPAHEKALALLQGYSASGDAVPLRDFASKVAPVVQQHLEHARSLQQ